MGLRVLHVVDNLGMGGAETWLIALLRHWRDQLQDAPQVDFLATGHCDGFFDEEAKELGARIFRVPFSWRRLPAFTRGLRHLLQVGAYDAIHDHQDYASGWHLLMGAGVLPPVKIVHVHNPAYQVQENYSVNLRRRIAGGMGQALIARFATHITGTSRQAIVEHGLDVPPMAHIPKSALHCGFDTTPFLVDREVAKLAVCSEFGWPADTRIVLVVGRIDFSPDVGHPRNHKNSGFATEIAMAAALLEPRLRVLFAGPLSPAVPVLERRIFDAGLAGRIVFAGIRRDIPLLMAASEALLFPSRSEGLGMVAVEAQAAGIPTLASTEVPRECVVVPRLVVFKALGNVHDWAQALLNLPPPMGPEANRLVAASVFSIEHSAATLERLYRTGALE